MYLDNDYCNCVRTNDNLNIISETRLITLQAKSQKRKDRARNVAHPANTTAIFSCLEDK